MTSAGTTPRTHEYELGHSDWELERLRPQAELADPFTRQFYRDAGISKGMRVLDVVSTRWVPGSKRASGLLGR